MTDAEYKAKQLEESRIKLKKMKEEAYEGALKNQYGMGVEDEEDTPTEDGFLARVWKQ